MLIISSIILLISNALTEKRELSIHFSRSLMFFLFLLTLLIMDNYNISLSSKGLAIYSGLFYIKPFIQVFSVFICIITALITILTSYYPRKLFNNDKQQITELFSNKNIDNKNVNMKKADNIEKLFIENENLEQFKIIEYPLLILFVLNGALLLMSCNDLVSIFLCIELQSYGLYLLCAVYRNSELSTEAALTYFLLGGLSSCIILLGQSLLYINSGNTNIEGIFIISNISDQINYNLLINNLDFMNIYQYYIEISLVVLSVGFLFKISAAPFHFWSPGVYDQIPTVVTTFVAIVAKISILIMLFELVYYTNGLTSEFLNVSWKNSLLLSSLLSLIIGSLLGLTQSRIKRLYAYSTISHLGFILLALSVVSIESSSAFFFYIIQYSITNLNAFLILIAIGYTLYNTSIVQTSTDQSKQDLYNSNKDTSLNKIFTKDEENRNYSPLQYTNEMANYYKINTVLALSLAITLFSFLGVPPLLGFFGKQMVISASLDRGYIFMVLIAIITSVISAVYYLIIVKVLFFDNSKQDSDLNNKESDHVNIEKSIDNKGNSIKPANSASSANSWFIFFNNKKIVLTSSLSNIISIITLILTMFMFITKENMSLFLLLSLYQAK